MVYNVIGLMSGSSLDGLDIAFVQLTEQRGKWSFEILEAECIDYEAVWAERLKNAANLLVGEFLKLHTAYGRWTGEQVAAFIERHALDHKVHFIASHGHTVFHEPASYTTAQIGDGAAIAAVTGLPVITDLRALDVALGGQGAPIVPIGDRLLFPQYGCLLNLGGIANMTVQGTENVGFDIGPANAVLNRLAERAGKMYDDNGDISRRGTVIPDLLNGLAMPEYYKLPAPKSLSNEQALKLAAAVLNDTGEHKIEDLLATFTEHLAMQIAEAVARYHLGGGELLITGGGAFNSFLVERITAHLEPLHVIPGVPDEKTIKFKEALVMALIGTLRWREEANTFSAFTGASRNAVGGALWMGMEG